MMNNDVLTCALKQVPDSPFSLCYYVHMSIKLAFVSGLWTPPFSRFDALMYSTSLPRQADGCGFALNGGIRGLGEAEDR